MDILVQVYYNKYTNKYRLMEAETVTTREAFEEVRATFEARGLEAIPATEAKPEDFSDPGKVIIYWA